MIYNNKKALEMQIILIFILVLALILFAIFWFTGLGQQATELASNFFSSIFG